MPVVEWDHICLLACFECSDQLQAISHASVLRTQRGLRLTGYDLLPDGCWGEDYQKGDASVCHDRVAQICARRRYAGYGRPGAEPWSPLSEGQFAGSGHPRCDGGPGQGRSLSYATPGLGKVATVGIGVDGTCMLICEQKWREAMTGSISLYDKRGERLHTIYIGAAPEYGKEMFFNRMNREIDHVKSLYPRALFAGIADGAKSNWDFLGPYIDWR
jgi:hypothetical protein